MLRWGRVNCDWAVVMKVLRAAVLVLGVAGPVFAGDCDTLCDPEFYKTATADGLHQVIEAGADVNARDDVGRVALHWSAGASPAVVSALLQAGADVHARDMYDRTPLHFVSAGGSAENITLLLQAGADVNARTANDWTPLHGVAKFGAPENVALLLAAGADGSAQTQMGETAFVLGQTNARMAGTEALEVLRAVQ